jgi:hypothetical protein
LCRTCGNDARARRISVAQPLLLVILSEAKNLAVETAKARFFAA